MALQGKGIMIWKVKDCEGGNPAAIAKTAVNMGLTHVMLKIADSRYAYNIDKTTNTDLIPPLAQALRAKGLQVWGWHYVYGYDPIGEADIAIKQVKNSNLDGYVIDAEVEYMQAGRDAVARTFMTRLRKSLPSLPVAVCSFRFPTYQPTFPWKAFLEKCDYNMPQVYWMQAHNAGDQLARSLKEFKAITPFRPLVPVGPAFTEAGWTPTAAELKEFMKTAQNLGMPGVDFFSWDECQYRHPTLWSAIGGYSWPVSAPEKTPPQALIAALNTRDAAAVAALYAPNAVHVTAERTVQGSAEIQAWYTQFLRTLFSGGTFELTSSSGEDPTHHLTWRGTTPRSKIENGKDTLGMLNGKIAYHYSSFTISPSS